MLIAVEKVKFIASFIIIFGTLSFAISPSYSRVAAESVGDLAREERERPETEARKIEWESVSGVTMGWLLRLVTGAPLVVGGPRQF